ncbi:MAG: ankyrin repeat domain-containing protein [Candidatus Aenigmatarchaeota archaeon]
MLKLNLNKNSKTKKNENIIKGLSKKFFYYYKAKTMEIFYKSNKEKFYIQLIKIIQNKQIDMLKLLIDKQIVSLNKNFDGENLFLFAVKHGNLNVIKFLVDLGADINTKTDLHMTALHYACLFQKLPVVSFLVEKGCDCTAKTNGGITPIYMALQGYNFDSVELLIENIRKNKLIDTTTHYIAQTGEIKKMEFMLEKFPEAANFKDEYGCLPIHYAHLEEDNELIKLLKKYTTLEYSLDQIPEKLVYKKFFSYAKVNKHIALLNLIKNFDISVNARDEEGNTVLHYAALFNCVETVMSLLINCYDIEINALNNKNKTPIEIAFEADNKKIVDILLANGALLREPYASLIR